MKRSPMPQRRTPLRSRGRKVEREQPALAAMKLGVHLRSGGMCEVRTPSCRVGPHEGSDVHHRLMRSQGGSHDPENGLLVCPPAHIYIHANPGESYQRGWLVRSWEASA